MKGAGRKDRTPRRSGLRIVFFLILTVLGAHAPLTLAGSPQLKVILPRGGQRGTQVTINLHGARLGDAQAIVLDDPSFSVAELKVINNQHLQVTLDITEACRLGAHAFRVRTATGISNLETFSVGALREVAESEPNNAMEKAQVIELDSTVNGIAQNEDVDYYAFQAIAGERISIEIEAMRLGDVLFDVFLALFDDQGFELASCDDAALMRQDAFISVVIPEDGRYVVQVRESAYAGNGNCRYRLHVGRFARPAAVFPLGGRPGETLNLTWLGETSIEAKNEVTLPLLDQVLSTAGGWMSPGVMGVFAAGDSGIAPSPNWLRVTELDNFLESEPNDRIKQANVFKTPCAINGIIEKPLERDCFRFTARQGQSFDIVVFARRLRTPLDAVLSIRDGNGKYLAGNDDSGGPDSAFRFTAKEDGEHVLIIRDHLNKGGPDFAYRIEIAPARPFVRVEAHRKIQAVAVPKGGRAPMMLTATRNEVGGQLTVFASNLPVGVTMHVAEVRPGVNQIPVVFEALPEAELGHGLAKITLSASGSEGEPIGGYRQDVELTLGRNNVVFMAHSVDRMPIAIVEKAPFEIEVVVPDVPLVRNGSMQLLIKATREEGYDEPINLRVPFRPSGVGASNSIVIKKGQNEARIPFNANGNASLGEWHFLVAAHAKLPGGGTMQISSRLFPITIAEPFVAFRPQSMSVEQGQVADLYIEVQTLEEFTETASVDLRGLPHHVTAEPVELLPGQTSVTFNVRTESDSPPGVHKRVFCIVKFTRNGQPIVHRLPAGELRIEKPLPTQVAQAPPPPPPADPKPQAEQPLKPKPLTRLEKLRQAHKTRNPEDETQGGVK